MENSGDGSVGDCFKGATIEKNGVLVNQYVSCSFDPATLVCITCSKEHGILEGGGRGQSVLFLVTKISSPLFRALTQRNV